MKARRHHVGHADGANGIVKVGDTVRWDEGPDGTAEVYDLYIGANGVERARLYVNPFAQRPRFVNAANLVRVEVAK